MRSATDAAEARDPRDVHAEGRASGDREVRPAPAKRSASGHPEPELALLDRVEERHRLTGGETVI